MPTREKPRAVVLATDVCSYSTPVINLAVEIAASAGIGVRGLFVEDPGLLALSESPLTREISLTTASSRPGSNERLRRLQRMLWRQFESTLQREAQALKITWSCEYVRGRVEEIGLRGGNDTRLAVLGKTGLHRIGGGPVVSMRRVLLVLDNAAKQADVLAVLLRHLGNHPKQVTLVTDLSAQGAALELQSRIASSGDKFVLVETDRSHLAELLGQVGSSFDFAILPLRENMEELTTMLKALCCPVILVA